MTGIPQAVETVNGERAVSMETQASKKKNCSMWEEMKMLKREIRETQVRRMITMQMNRNDP